MHLKDDNNRCMSSMSNQKSNYGVMTVNKNIKAD